MGFPGGTSKEPACQCRRHKRHGFDPWVRKIPWRRAWQPTPAFSPEHPIERGDCWATVHGVTQNQTRLKRLSTYAHKVSPLTSCSIRKGKGQQPHWGLRVKYAIIVRIPPGNFHNPHSMNFLECKLVPYALLQSFPVDSQVLMAITISSVHPLLNSLLLLQLFLLEKKQKTKKQKSFFMSANCYKDTCRN